MKSKTILPILFFSLLFLNSCEDKKSDKTDDLVGTWEAVSVSVTLEDGTFFSVPITDDFSMTLRLKDDGTFTMTQTDGGETDVSSGSWSADNGRITIIEQGEMETIDYDLNGDELTLSITQYDADFGGMALMTIEFRRV